MGETSRWPKLFGEALGIIEQAKGRAGPISWTFGGGTALMLQIGHRESFDVDIFISDPQLLPYLHPIRQGYVTGLRPKACVADGVRSLKIAFDGIGEIDFVCAAPLTETPALKTEVFGHRVELESPAEIIAKKIFYRGATLQPRDMFDIACVTRICGRDELVEALSFLRTGCEKALRATRRMNPLFAQGIMQRLLYRPEFADMVFRAQDMTADLLEEACRKG